MRRNRRRGTGAYDHGVGVRDHRHYEVKRIDAGYFEGDI
jgi:restriction endonuclease Mrr